MAARKIYKGQRVRIRSGGVAVTTGIARVLRVRRGVADIKFSNGEEMSLPVEQLVFDDPRTRALGGQLTLF